mgnify:CR=1 FL=1
MWYDPGTGKFGISTTTASMIARIKENKKITITKKNAGNRFVIATSTEKPAIGVKYKQIVADNESNRTEYSFTNENEKWLWFGVYNGTDETEKQKALEEIQVEIGDKTDYEEHKEQKIILDIQKEMLAGDYFVKENDGWKEVHNWDIVSFNGTENSWILTQDIAHRFRVNYDNTSLNDSNQYCTHSKTRSNWAVNNGEFSVRTPNEIYFNSSDFNTLEEFKAWLVQQNTNGTPLTFYFKCEQYKINCTEAQIKALEQLNKLRFYKNVNNIYTTEDIALLQAEYEVDLQTLKGIPGPKRRQRRYRCERRYRSNWSKRR